MFRHLLAIIGYVVATFATQALSHFVVFKAHYDAIPFNAPSPIFVLGLASMLVQGAILSGVFVQSTFRERGMIGALGLSWLFGAFLVSYIALAEPAKYAVPNIGTWMLVEVVAGAVQYTLAGMALYFAHRRPI